MDVTTLPNGEIAMTLASDELPGVRQFLNEVCNGYKIPDFENRISVNDPAAAGGDPKK
jgi:hypothetical protein